MGPDAHIESVAALFELIPDARTEFLYFVAVERHGRVSVNRTWGVSYFALFEVEHLDAALARFEELRP